jgi:MFS family permease
MHGLRFTTAYRRYVLGMMTLVYTLNFLDRGLMSLLLEPIKHDLNLSDTQLGFLTGIAFALFYATLGVPVARWADRGNRVTIISSSIALWGATVSACLLVMNFHQLILARVAAGIGEAGCMPPTYSLIGDYFSKPAERTRAMAVYWLASPLSTLMSFVLGGLLSVRYGWRMTFFLLGLPALLIALIVKFTIVEPRANASRTLNERMPPPSLAAVVSSLWARHVTRHLILAIILLFTVGLGLAPWYAAFLIRSHGMGIATLGVWLGLIFAGSGIAGIGLGGYVCTRWFAEDERGQMRLSAVTVAAVVPFFILFLLLPSKALALGALVPLVLVVNFFLGPTFALLQRLVSEEMRATTVALVMLLANLIGMGVGPQIVGILSDELRTFAGGDSLRYAMLLMSLVALWAAWHFWQVGRTVKGALSADCARQPSHTTHREQPMYSD